jgi:hypothetical protein
MAQVSTSTGRIIILILIDGLRTALYFPVWWYSKGFIKMIKAIGRLIGDFNLTLGFTIWVKNLFVPMFGQRDIPGRLISFFLRLVNIIFRGLGLLFLICLTFIFIIIWLVVPVFIIFQLLIFIF